MQAKLIQHLALPHDARMIGMKTRDSCASCGCQTDYEAEIITPGEVIFPPVTARMKHCDYLPCSRVRSSGSVLLTFVAITAGKGEVTQFVRSTEVTRHNMVHGKPTGVEFFGITAVFTETVSLLDHLNTHRFRDNRHRRYSG